MKIDRSRLFPALLVAVTVVAAACSDVVEPRQAALDNPFAGLRAGLHPVVVVTEAGPVTTYAEVRLHREQTTASIASFQAELAYDTTLLSVLGSDFAPGVDGAWHEVSRGHVRFAGAAAAGLGDVPLATLRFSSKPTTSARAFELDFQELVGADDFSDLTSRVVAGKPLVVATYPSK